MIIYGVRVLQLIFFLLILILFGCRKEENFIEVEHIPIYSKQEFQILLPKSGDIWFTSSEYEIKWIPSSRAKNVVIELYRKNTLKKTISSKTENDGLFVYFVPNDLESSNLYRIKIINFDDSTESTFSNYFSIR